ncbi:MAG: hypothetical protein COU51_02325 [Parcubacteria group bacterium CG10_big_fil_rev_8_21_14_0_10_36_14]|nr:MAG: hypothetical protein COU51_02325 [Parcubacteria group bacterium CG10_big_fil_rev_8_21_14_0_10_36_14]
MEKNYLFLNTVNKDFPSFIIFNARGDFLFSEKFIPKQENIIEKLKTFFKKSKIKKEGISAILAIEGPGSFSGSRAGVTLANSFNFLFNTPVLGIKDSGDPVKKQIDKNMDKLKKIKASSTAKVYYKYPPNVT